MDTMHKNSINVGIILAFTLMIIPFAFAGIPEIITCPQDLQIYSGDTYNQKITVQDISDTGGSFILSIDCEEEGIEIRGSELFFESNEIKEFSFSTSGLNTNQNIPLNSLCTYTITDRKGGGIDSCSNILTIKYQGNIVCSPGKSTCSDTKNLKICAGDGLSFTKEECSGGCSILENGESQCNVKEKGNNTWIIYLGIVIILASVLFLIFRKKK
jgi:LPXTG-motif cell wall-anchored protein